MIFSVANDWYVMTYIYSIHDETGASVIMYYWIKQLLIEENSRGMYFCKTQSRTLQISKTKSDNEGTIKDDVVYPVLVRQLEQ